MPRIIQSQPSVRFNAVVSYKDLLGTTHNIVCTSRKQIKEAQSFLSQFKSDYAHVKAIAAQYSVKCGKFVNEYKLKRELADAGYNRAFVTRILKSAI